MFEHCKDGIRIHCCDCREMLPDLGPVDAVITDPPYGDTSLSWDKRARGWVSLIDAPTIWCFGSLRFWMECQEFRAAGYRYAQEIIWEKHNGSSVRADRFRRVHEIIVQWYRGKWSDLYKSPVQTPNATAKTIRTRTFPEHQKGKRSGVTYRSENGGPRLLRSVMQVRSMHGRAVHETQKPERLIAPLIEYSVPPGGTVLDPFMGSGTTLVVARSLGRKAIGLEISEEYCTLAKNRLAQLELF